MRAESLVLAGRICWFECEAERLAQSYVRGSAPMRCIGGPRLRSRVKKDRGMVQSRRLRQSLWFEGLQSWPLCATRRELFWISDW
jgi:hypothetical protein